MISKKNKSNGKDIEYNKKIKDLKNAYTHAYEEFNKYVEKIREEEADIRINAWFGGGKHELY